LFEASAEVSLSRKTICPGFSEAEAQEKPIYGYSQVLFASPLERKAWKGV
jgi:hypothetical protein